MSPRARRPQKVTSAADSEVIVPMSLLLEAYKALQEARNCVYDRAAIAATPKAELTDSEVVQKHRERLYNMAQKCAWAQGRLGAYIPDDIQPPQTQ